jgi:hypothetical protein
VTCHIPVFFYLSIEEEKIRFSRTAIFSSSNVTPALTKEQQQTEILGVVVLPIKSEAKS